MSIADLLVDAGRFVAENWPSLLGIAAAFALRKRVPALRLPRLADWKACALVFGVSLASSLGAAALHGVPMPEAHDDYGYLLAADTFAHGRLANPPHALAEHFETMHVLQRPTYAAKFPPGQGMVLALGFPAVWVLCALTCAAIWWALRVWLTPELALLGGLLAAIHPTMLSWAETYHGGALAALAGAVLLGALASTPAGWRASRPPGGETPPGQPAGRRRAAVLAALAIALFAYSRPYEGLVFTIAVVIAVRPPLPRLAAIAGVALLALVPLGIYNRAVTGSAFVLPYSLYEARYDPAPPFLWQSARRVPPAPNLEMATVYRVTYAGQWRRLQRPGGLRYEAMKKIDVIRQAVFGPPLLLLLVPLVAWPRAFKDQRVRRLSLVLILFAFAPFSITGWMQTHYLAPAAAVVVALMVLLINELPPSFAVAVLIAFVVNAGANFLKPSNEGGYERQRREIAASLDGVVIVAPDLFDVVYNSADIDGQRVIWARDLGPARNATLRAYYRGRRFWYLPTDGSSGPGRPRPLP